jgi:hypothetical protein
MCSTVERAVVAMELADVPAVVAACGRDILTRSLVWCRENAQLVAGKALAPGIMCFVLKCPVWERMHSQWQPSLLKDCTMIRAILSCLDAHA